MAFTLGMQVLMSIEERCRGWNWGRWWGRICLGWLSKRWWIWREKGRVERSRWIFSRGERAHVKVWKLHL
jgi:hypothetical protein